MILSCYPRSISIWELDIPSIWKINLRQCLESNPGDLFLGYGRTNVWCIFYCIFFSGNTFAEATVASKQFGTRTILKLWLLHLGNLNLGSSVGRVVCHLIFCSVNTKVFEIRTRCNFQFEVPQDQVELDRMQCLFFGSIPLAIFHADGCR